MYLLGILLFAVLVIADIVRIFKNDEEFDGLMLFARPIVAFVGALLCDGTFFGALLFALGWGFIGFVVASLISEHYGAHHANDEPTSVDSPFDEDIVRLVEIILNRIAPRYVAGIHIYVSDIYSSFLFYDYYNWQGDDLRCVIERKSLSASMDYRYFLFYQTEMTEEEATFLRKQWVNGSENHDDHEIVFKHRNSGIATINRIRELIKNCNSNVIVELGTDDIKSISFYCSPKGNNET